MERVIDCCDLVASRDLAFGEPRLPGQGGGGKGKDGKDAPQAKRQKTAAEKNESLLYISAGATDGSADPPAGGAKLRSLVLELRDVVFTVKKAEFDDDASGGRSKGDTYISPLILWDDREVEAALAAAEPTEEQALLLAKRGNLRELAQVAKLCRQKLLSPEVTEFLEKNDRDPVDAGAANKLKFVRFKYPESHPKAGNKVRGNETDEMSLEELLELGSPIICPTVVPIEPPPRPAGAAAGKRFREDEVTVFERHGTGKRIRGDRVVGCTYLGKVVRIRADCITRSTMGCTFKWFFEYASVVERPKRAARAHDNLPYEDDEPSNAAATGGASADAAIPADDAAAVPWPQ